MRRLSKATILFLIYSIVFFVLAYIVYWSGSIHCTHAAKPLMLSLDVYEDTHLTTLKEVILHRICVQPFNLVALILFGLAIIHTFFSHWFTVLSERIRKRNIRLKIEPVDSFSVEILRFFGEVEVVFGLWVIPLVVVMTYFYSWNTAVHYLEGRSYIEPMFVVVVMAITSTQPVIKLAEDCLRFVAKLGGQTVKAWWWVILTIGPLSGSLITEPGAMTISALLLAKKYYELKPNPVFSYATLGLLFTNISVGGVFTSFAAPAVLMVSGKWGWDTPYMMAHFGWKAVLGILIANGVYFFIFRKEFSKLEEKKKSLQEMEEDHIPFWISLTHVAFLAWIVVHSHHPVIFISSFLLFLGFFQATRPYQHKLRLKPPVLVGFFLAGLIIHGSLQGWWMAPLLSKVSSELLLVLSMFLTSFNDNAEITFLATLIPSFDDAMKYAVLAGAVTGGGLTVIANAPNPLGQAILGKYFYRGISALRLLAGALFPAVVMALIFYLLRSI